MWDSRIQTELRKRSNDKLGAAVKTTGEANARAEEARQATAQLESENLALQAVMLPRNLGLVGFNGPAPADAWFAPLLQLTNIEVSIQSMPDLEAQNLAQALFIVLGRIGWKPIFIDEKRSNLPPNRIGEGVSVSYPVGEPWTEENQNQPWFAWAGATNLLTMALTNAGLGVLDVPVSSFGFTNELRPYPVPIPRFDPPLTGIFVQIGARPISLTIQMLRLKRQQAAEAELAARQTANTDSAKME